MELPKRALACLAATAISCGGGSSVQPTPTADPPVLTCPSPLSVASHNGQQPTIVFDAPTVLSGALPTRTTCTPASGTAFPNGVTVVSCDVTDAINRRAGCTFTVSVTPVPLLAKTTFMAFGDSLTEGKTGLIGGTNAIVVVPDGKFNNSASYVEQLSAKLSARYQDQTTTVIADGLGGERASDAGKRLSADLAVLRPDAVLLMTGSNDLLNSPPGPATISAILDAIQAMVRDAKGRGVRVFLGTLPPMNADAPRPRATPDGAAGIAPLNDRIRALAIQEGVTLVDVNAAVPRSVLAADGLHLTPQGYELMADEWLSGISSVLEIKTGLP